jgi:hypothetical protein
MRPSQIGSSALVAGERTPLDEPGRRGLFVGVLAYRWVALVWMTVLAFVDAGELRSPGGAFAALGITVAWNAYFTVSKGWLRPWARYVDLGWSIGLLPLSGSVMQPGATGGGAPFFA